MSNKKDEEFVSELKIDGLVLISDKWTFLNPTQNAYIEYPIKISALDIRKKLKGNRCLQKFKNAWSVKLFNVCDMRVTLILLSNLDNIPYTNILKKINLCLQKTLESLPHSQTAKLHLQKTTTNKSFEILLCDFSTFGETFSDYLLDQIQEQETVDPFNENSFGLINVKFVAQSFGQTCPFDYMLQHMKTINWSLVEETLIHYALDTHVTKKALFWRRKTLIEALNSYPNYDYFPLALRGYGNFYFHSRSSCTDQNFKIQLVKFYSELNKYCKQNKTLFKTAEIANFLFSGNNIVPASLKPSKIRQLLTSASEFTDNCETILRLVEGIKHFLSLYARCECVLSVMNVSCNPLEEGKSVFLDFVLDTNATAKRNCLLIDVSAVQKRLDFYLSSSMKTILSHVKNFERFLTSPEYSYFFDFATFRDVKAAEAVTCFMLYGIAVSTRKFRAHDNQMLRDMGLIQTCFQKEDKRINTSVGNNRLSLSNRGLHYVARSGIMIYPELCQSTFNFKNGIDLSRNFQHNPIKFVIRMCDYLILAICTSTVKSQKPEASFKRLSDTLRLASFSKNVEVIHCAHFVAKIFEISDSHLGGHYLWKTVRLILIDVCSEENINFLKSLLCVHLSKLLVKQETPIGFTLLNIKKFVVVVPLYDVADRNSGMHVFKQAFYIKYKFSNLVIDDYVCKIFNVAKNLDLEFLISFNHLNDIFSKILVASTLKNPITEEDVASWFGMNVIL